MKTLLTICIVLALSTAALAQEWSTPVRISEPGGGFYPQIIAQGDTLHVVYENARGYDKICYIRSTDAGETWSEHVILSEHNGLTSFPRILRWQPRLCGGHEQGRVLYRGYISGRGYFIGE
jgi:hypothetical protein